MNVGSVERNVNLVGVTEGFQQIRNLLILQGRFLDADDISSRSRVCLITTQLANFVFPFMDPIGQSLRVGELSFTVIGVFRERVETFGLSEIQDYSVLVPFPLMKYYLGDSSLEMLYVQASTPEGVIPVTRQLEALLTQPASHARALFGAESQFHPGGGAKNRAGAHHRSAADRIHRAAGQRHRNHEHHAGDRAGAHAGDRNSQGDRSEAAAKFCISFCWRHS